MNFFRTVKFTIDFDPLALTDPVPVEPSVVLSTAPQYFEAPFYSDLIACTACPIRKEARQVVPGVGPADAMIGLLGQNPGQDEDRDGRPFCGRAGKQLDQIIEALGLNRDRLFISNVVRCHTLKNREPTTAEVTVCRDLWLPKELAFFTELTVLITLGNPATKAVLGKQTVTTGSFQLYEALVTHAGRSYAVFPVAHPAYVLRSTVSKAKLYTRLLPELRTYLQRHHGTAYARSQ